MFGIGKKKTASDILADIDKLDESEKSKLLQILTSEGSEESIQNEGTEQVSEETNGIPSETPQTAEGEAETESVEGTGADEEKLAGAPENEAEQPPKTPVSENPDEPMAEIPEPATTEEAAEPIAEVPQTDKMQELIDAQKVRIDSLESELSAMKEKIDTIISKQDNRNFGCSPSADFSDDERSAKRDAVINGYAPRHANDYK